MSVEEQKLRYQQLVNARRQRNMDRRMAQQEQNVVHSNSPYALNATMMNYPVNGPVGQVTVGMDTRLSNQATLGNGLLSNKMLGVDSQGQPDGCCPQSGPCPNLNPLSGPTCTNACKIVSKSLRVNIFGKCISQNKSSSRF